MSITCRLSPALLAALLACWPVAARAQTYDRACQVEILVDGHPVPQYLAARPRDVAGPSGFAPATLSRFSYVEALKGREYAIRLHNPLNVRVAVALSVDGLNTIDARRTSAREARKWVLDPHETVTISGWQTSMSQARRFFFTTEDRSYAARLGQAENTGVISAVFFRERAARVVPLGMTAQPQAEAGRAKAGTPPADARSGSERSSAEAATPSALPGPPPSDEYAATGIGERVNHPVRRVHLDLEDQPASLVDIRYEYRAQLVRLGVLSDHGPADQLERREKARGFEGFCPDIR